MRGWEILRRYKVPLRYAHFHALFKLDLLISKVYMVVSRESVVLFHKHHGSYFHGRNQCLLLSVGLCSFTIFLASQKLSGR